MIPASTGAVWARAEARSNAVAWAAATSADRACSAYLAAKRYVQPLGRRAIAVAAAFHHSDAFCSAVPPSEAGRASSATALATTVHGLD